MITTLKNIERSLVVFCFILMVFLYALNVVVREVLPDYAIRLAWTEDASRLAMIWGIFLAAGLTLERGSHIAMASILLKMPLRIQAIVNVIINAIGSVFCAYLAYLAASLSVFVYKTGQVNPALDISSAYLYIAPAIGFALISIRYFLGFLGLIKWRHENVEEQL